MGLLASSAPTWPSRLRTFLVRLAGMPDYQQYVSHLHAHHPGQPVLSEAEFFRQYLEARQAGGPPRCC